MWLEIVILSTFYNKSKLNTLRNFATLKQRQLRTMLIHWTLVSQ